MLKNNLYLALIHFPVINKKDKTIGSALTTIDLHDIARASITFGVRGFYVITPYKDQAKLATQVMEHWTKGVGGKLNPDRKKALELIRIKRTFREALSSIEKERSQSVVSIATSAKDTSGAKAPGAVAPDLITIGELNQKLKNKASHVLVFGTAWGLADELIDTCDFILDPIYGTTDYNHLSVRSAVSIYLDRIRNDR